MKIDAGDHEWIVSLNYPSGGAIWQTINMIKGRGTSKPWRQAFKEAGASWLTELPCGRTPMPTLSGWRVLIVGSERRFAAHQPRGAVHGNVQPARDRSPHGTRGITDEHEHRWEPQCCRQTIGELA
jgi:hypothetical protein